MPNSAVAPDLNDLDFSPSPVDSRPAPENRRLTFKRTTAFEWMFVVLGGLPLYAPILLLLGERGLSGQNPIYWYFWVNAIISSPHVYSTYARLGRKITERKVSWWFGVPLYLLTFGALALASEAGYFVEAMTAVNLWQSVHYCRQVYGVSRLMGRNGDEDAFTKRLSFYGYHLAMPLFVLGRWDVLYTVWGGKASGAIIPYDVSSVVMGLCWAVAIVGMAAGLLAELRTYRKAQNGYNVARLVTLIIYYAIHIVGFLSITFYQRGFFAVTIFHAVQYLALVWMLERSKATGRTERVFKSLPRLLAFPAFWAAFFVGAYLLENHVFMAANGLWPLMASVGLAAVSAHHYAVDSVMWRRKVGA